MKKFLTCIGATLAFWVLMFLGPALVMLVNNIGYYVSGGGWGPNSLMYKVLQFFSQPIACALAFSAAGSICGDRHPVCVLTNCIVAACVCVLLTISGFALGNNLNAAQMIVSAVACIACAVSLVKSWNVSKP
jgi:hypothetical protein